MCLPSFLTRKWVDSHQFEKICMIMSQFGGIMDLESGKLLGRDDEALSKFLAESEVERGDIKEILRTRNFAGEVDLSVRKATNFLNGANSQLAGFQAAVDLPIKTEFLKSLIRAWEIADATGTFNDTTLNAYSRIKEFSNLCLEKIAKAPRNPNLPRSQKVYWQEVARAGLIQIVELYRAQRLTQCVRELDKLVSFVQEGLKDEN